MYYLRTKSRLLRSRDPESGEMKDIGPRKWVGFDVLPAGISPEGDGELTVKYIACPEDLEAIEAENKRMADEDEIVTEKREERRQAAADDKAHKDSEKAAALAAKHPEGWKPRDPDRDRLIALGWTPPPEAFVGMNPLNDDEPSTLEGFVDKHMEKTKDELIEWAEKLEVSSDGNKADILAVIYASQIAG